MKVLSANYPEWNAASVFINIPTVSSFLLSGAMLVMPEKTRSKVLSVREECYNDLMEICSPSLLPEVYGGFYQPKEQDDLSGNILLTDPSFRTYPPSKNMLPDASPNDGYSVVAAYSTNKVPVMTLESGLHKINISVKSLWGPLTLSVFEEQIKVTSGSPTKKKPAKNFIVKGTELSEKTISVKLNVNGPARLVLQFDNPALMTSKLAVFLLEPQ